MIAERYLVERTLKAGDAVETLLARDVPQGRQVVVKRARAESVSAAAQMRLEHEAQILRRIASTTFAPLVGFGREDGTIYLVMPFIPGITLRERLDSGRLSVPEALTVGTRILGALHEAHGHGVLHRDVKPGNVIVDEHSPIETATLIDFGLATSAGPALAVQQRWAGTARYVSPEQAGLVDHDVDLRSDLYSVGILLFESLVGHPPFEAESVGELLRMHLTARPPDLATLGVDAPRVLDEVIQRLLAKDPPDRYQSADAALADLTEIATALRRGLREPTLVVGMQDQRRTLTEPAFVGRDEQLDQLDRQLDGLADGARALVTVKADSGGGKTRLLDEFARRAARRDAWVLRGQGVDQSAPGPFRMLSGVAETIAAADVAEPAVTAALREAVGARRETIAAALPVIATALGCEPADAEAGPEAFGEVRSVEALAELLDALGSSGRPAVVLLDDCQWADELTLKLLREWAGRRARASRVLVVVAFRSEEVGPEHPLRALGSTLDLELEPFGPEAVQRVSESMAGELPPEALEVVTELSGGNPFMVSAVLRGLVESGALRDEEFGWRVVPELLSEAQSSRRAAAFLAKRLDLLPPETLELLAVAAVLGKEFDIELAARLAEQSATVAVPSLEEARRRHIVWASGDASRGAFVHDKLRETLLARLAPEHRRRLHTLAAERGEEEAEPRVFELAYHFDAAGEPGRSLPYALEAAKEARRRHSLDVAEEQYRIAERGIAAANREQHASIALGLGEVLMLRGHYDEAETYLTTAGELVEDDLARSRIEGRLGELSFKRGEVARAVPAIERALRLLGQRVPRSRAGYLLACATEVVRQALHTLLPGLFVGRRKLERGKVDLLAATLHSNLAHAHWFASGRLETLWTHLRGLNLAERYPPTEERAQAYSEHAPVLTMIPWFARGIRYAERSLEIRRSKGDAWGEGRSLHFYGVVLYNASQYERCIERCSEAVRLLERAGDHWEINTARWHIAFAQYRLGRLPDAIETAKSVHAAGLRIGDAQASGISLGAWAKAGGGRVPQDVLELELARRTEDGHTRAELLQAEAVRLLGAGRPAEAVTALEEATDLVRRRGLRQEYVAPIGAWMATALREEAERTPSTAEPRRRAMLKRARRTVRRANRLAGWYRNNRPHTLRELALAEAAAGHNRRAQRRFAAALATAEEQGARFEYGQTLLARGRVGLGLGWPGAAADVASAERDLGALRGDPAATPAQDAGVVGPQSFGRMTISLADRFDTLLDTGRGIATALSRDEVFEAVTEAGMTLLRGERCLVVPLPLTGADEAAFEYLDALGLALVDRAVKDRAPAVFSDAEPSDESTSESGALSGVRSALCAPIFVRGEAVACLYTSHGGVSELFGHEEQRLAAFIATLAGGALENAEGFASVQDLTRSLEQRVEERTAELEESNRRLDLSVGQLREAYDRERQAADQLKHQAFHDSLTSLANRALFTDRVDHALRRAERLHARVAVMFLDLDDFKTVNDSLGHTVGDQLLVSVADRLRDCLRDGDTAARLGGDEFAILIEDVRDAGDAARTAQRIIDALDSPFVLDTREAGGSEVFVHPSIGIALGSADKTPGDVGELLRNADVAMYIAKGRGKRRYEFFEPSMHTGVLERLALKRDLSRAFERGEFVLHYQPIVDLDGGALVGLEALIRWQHPERGLVAPAAFVPLAEETGLIRPIGHWVLREACRRAVSWSDARGGREPLSVNVNLSPSQLQEPGLVGEVAAALSRSGLAPSQLVLEITETVLMQDTEVTIRRLRRLKDLGVRLAIDDFGTGYSSLGYLQRFPIDIIKVAKPFVDNLERGEDESALVRAILKLADAFGLQTVAEGIEREGQLERLQAMGCALGQGFHFARPLEPNAADALVRESPVVPSG